VRLLVSFSSLGGVSSPPPLVSAACRVFSSKKHHSSKMNIPELRIHDMLARILLFSSFTFKMQTKKKIKIQKEVTKQ
jgi:hypothetical protein